MSDQWLRLVGPNLNVSDKWLPRYLLLINCHADESNSYPWTSHRRAKIILKSESSLGFDEMHGHLNVCIINACNLQMCKI